MLYRLFCSVFIFCLVMELMYNELNTLNQCLYYFFCRKAHHTKVTKESNRIENRRVYIYIPSNLAAIVEIYHQS